jgi:hypothetical protein
VHVLTNTGFSFGYMVCCILTTRDARLVTMVGMYMYFLHDGAAFHYARPVIQHFNDTFTDHQDLEN